MATPAAAVEEDWQPREAAAQVVSSKGAKAEEHFQMVLWEAMVEEQEVLNENRWLEVEEEAEAAPGRDSVLEELADR